MDEWLPANGSYLSGGNQYILEWKGNLIPGLKIKAVSLNVFGIITVTPGCRMLVFDMYNDIGPVLLSEPIFFHPGSASTGSNVWAFFGSKRFDSLEVAYNQNTIKMTLLAPDDLVNYVSTKNVTPFNSNGAVTGGNALLLGD